MTIQKYDLVSSNTKLNANGWSVPLSLNFRVIHLFTVSILGTMLLQCMILEISISCNFQYHSSMPCYCTWEMGLVADVKPLTIKDNILYHQV